MDNDSHSLRQLNIYQGRCHCRVPISLDGGSLEYARVRMEWAGTDQNMFARIPAPADGCARNRPPGWVADALSAPQRYLNLKICMKAGPIELELPGVRSSACTTWGSEAITPRTSFSIQIRTLLFSSRSCLTT